jgi:hypothetical protein
LQEVRRAPDGSIFLSDADVTLVLTKKQSIGKAGIQYFGIQVGNWSAAEARFKEIGVDLPGPRGADTEVQMTDPEGNLFVLSERGWQA